MEMLNVDTEAEIRDKLLDDIEHFNVECEGNYKNYIGIFTNFLDEYRDNLLELDKLMKQQVQIMSASQFINTNNVGSGVSIGSVSLNGSRGTYGNLDLSRDYMQEALDAAASGDLDKAMALLDMRNEKVDIQHGWDRGTNADLAYERVMNAYNSRGYAEGIENGPVEETGLAMLHGTPSSPEYVLNTEQAGQLLENLATTDFSEDTRGTATVSQADESTATTGVTGNARTELEGINKIISQISALINHEALTNSNLTQIAEILRNMNETNNLIQQIVASDVEKDEARYAEFKELLAEYYDSLIPYLDGFNEKLDTGNATLNSLLDAINEGIASLNDLLGNMMNEINSLGSQIGGSGLGLGSGSSGGSSSSNSGYKYYYSDDYLQDAIDRANSGDWEGAMESLWNRDNKIHHTGEDYGTNSSQAQDLIDSIFNGRSYAEGIENGAVTETGPAMLHGTEQNPEYVLNSDQAGQLLENMATTDMSETGEGERRGTQTVSTMDEGSATTGVTGNARTTLEGINKLISQVSAMINAQSLTNSSLIQITEILRMLNENQAILQELIKQDYTADQAHYDALMEWLNEQVNGLLEYLDGYNERLDNGLTKLDDILAGINQGIEAINGLIGEIQGLASSVASMGSMGGSSGGSLGGGGSSGGSSKGFDFSKDYLQLAIDSAKRGDIAAMNQALQDRNYKVSVTGQNYGTNSSAARQEAESYLKGYAGGLDEGPVTETGPAMLHGTPSEPEYVLSNDQAYNMLDNLTSATTTGEEATEVVDDTLATGGIETGTEGAEVEGVEGEGEGESKEGEGKDERGESKKGKSKGKDTLLDEAGTSQNGAATTTLQGINKIITQISALINQQSLTNSQLIQANTLIQMLMELITTIQAVQNQEVETNAQRYEEYMEIVNGFIETWIETLTTMGERHDMTNEYLLNMLDLLTQQIELLNSITQTLDGGFSGKWSGYKSGDFSGDFNGSSGAGGEGFGGEEDEWGYGGGGGASRPDKADYQTGWYDSGTDYLAKAIEMAQQGKTDEAYEALLRRSYKILDTGDNNGTTQAQAVQQIKNILASGGYNTESSLGDSAVYDADRYMSDLADYNASLSSGSSSSSGGGGRRPNYGGYDSKDDFDNAIHDAFDKASSSGQNVSIGNSGLYIDASKINKSKSYASGIENGPVTYTGMAMLHGSPSNPEFVLNSDQAYNILRNMATSKATEFETEGGSEGDTNYIVQGDIVLKTDTDPGKFWQEVSRSMSRRWNTNKNNRRGK